MVVRNGQRGFRTPYVDSPWRDPLGGHTHYVRGDGRATDCQEVSSWDMPGVGAVVMVGFGRDGGVMGSAWAFCIVWVSERIPLREPCDGRAFPLRGL